MQNITEKQYKKLIRQYQIVAASRTELEGVWEKIRTALEEDRMLDAASVTRFCVDLQHLCAAQHLLCQECTDLGIPVPKHTADFLQQIQGCRDVQGKTK